MSKFANINIVLLGVIILLQFGGILTANDTLLARIGFTSSNYLTSYFYLAIIALFSFSATAGISMGLMGRTSWDWAILSFYAVPILVIFLGAAPSIIEYSHGLSSWVYNLIRILFGVVTIAYIFSLAEWVFNRQ
jgi:hypothetical protein